jgi:hypothetical protein
MEAMASSAPPTIDLADLGLDEGGHLLVARGLMACAIGEGVVVAGRHPQLRLHLSTWARAAGHEYREVDGHAVVVRGRVHDDRWRGSVRAASATETPAPSWGFAVRGALIEAGGPDAVADIVDPADAWVALAPQLYAQAVAGQWDPATAVPWDTPRTHDDDAEGAVVQVMTYLVENELAALVVPSRFIARIHPHFREVLQLLAVQCADEARHVEVFTRRATLYGGALGTSSAGGRASLHTLVTEPDYHLATFLLSVLGEGSFLSLLAFVERHAPDLVARTVARLALQDEARHVAFGQAHLEHVVATDANARAALRAAVERRHAALADTAGLNADVFDALVILAAGSWQPDAIRTGFRAVQALQTDMDTGRRRRLVRLGFPDAEARALSDLHTRNFM